MTPPNTIALLEAESSHQAAQANSSSDETIPYSNLSSDETIPYSENLVHSDDNIPKPKAGKGTKCFNINIHGIKKRKCQYQFVCMNKECKRSFTQVGDWNAHHRLVHKNKITCNECGLKFTTPSAHRAHRNFHAVHKFTCPICKRTFAFISGQKQHMTAHRRSRLHRCFHGNCSKSYKWPQDLVRHVHRHLNEVWTCSECGKTFKEKRLLNRHSNKHDDTY